MVGTVVAVVIVAALADGFAARRGPARPATSTADAGISMQVAQDESAVATSAPFPTDARGWTYGAIPDRGRAPYAEWPDLVAVFFDGTAKVGFVHKADLHLSDDPADNPRTPALMLAYASTLPTAATVYAPDGTTVLGSVPIGPTRRSR
ncbi:hypothetical protein [Nocardioides ultimimeridianus]